MIKLKDFLNPSKVKELNDNELNELSSLLREEILKQVSIHGGHLSSNLGAIESTIALCKSFDFNNDRLLFDVGHQSYAYKLLTGRSLDTLRQKDGVSGFQKITESKYDVFDAGHSSTAISVASAYAYVRDEHKDNYHIVVFIGDAALDNGVSYEGLRFLGNHNNNVIIVLNDNTDANKESIFTKSLFSSFGIDYLGPINGHNINEMCRAFENAKTSTKSTLVHLKTIKGHGYSYSENDIKNLYHGVSPFNIENGKSVKKNELYSFQDAVLESLDKQLSLDNKNILICPATMIGSNIYNLSLKHENQFVDVGINEEHAFLYASGLSLNGFRPIISVYSTFLQRGYDEIIHDLSRNNLSATLLIDRAGLVGADGETHQGIFDSSLLYNMPNTVIATPSKASYIDSLLKLSFETEGVFAIRYGKDKGDSIKETLNASFDTFDVLKESFSDIAILSVGPNSIELTDLTENNNIDVSIYCPLFVKPFNKLLLNKLATYKKVIIYDPTSIESGFALDLYYKLKQLNKDIEIIVKAIPLKHIAQATIKEQEEVLKISLKDIIDLLRG